MAEFNLIKFEGKPLEKLLSMIKSLVGALYAPTKIKKLADAEAYRITVVERAKSNANIENQELNQQFLERTESRILQREIQKQINLESVISKAADQLKLEQTVSEEPVNKDWTTRFFNIAEDISDNDLQNLFAQILTGEIKHPSTYSLRTLELLRNLTSKQARIFQYFCDYVIYTDSKALVHFDYSNDDYLRNFGITTDHINVLTELNLISSYSKFARISMFDSLASKKLKYGNLTIALEVGSRDQNVHIQGLVLTTIGFELFQINKGKQKPNKDYLNKFKDYIKDQKWVNKQYENF